MSGKMRLFMSVCIYFSLFSLLVSYALSQINFAQIPINSKFIQINPIQGNDNQSRLYGGPQAFDCIEKLLNEFRFNFDFDKLQQMMEKCMSQDFPYQSPEKPLPDQLKPKEI